MHASSLTAYTNPAGNGTAESFASDRWAIGDYWQFKTDSTGYDNIRISFDQGSSNTGPKDFTLSYSTDGTTFTAFADYSVLSYAVNPAWSAGTYQSIYSFNFDLSAISTLDNDSDIYFRLSMRTTAAAGSANPVATGGLNRVDTVTVTGDLIPPVVPLPGAAFGGISLLMASALFSRRRE